MSNSLRLALLVLACVLASGVPVFGQDDAARIHQIPPGPYRVAGTAVNAKTGAPIARVRVTVADTKIRQNLQSMVTSDDGHFEFHLPAGKFSLTGEKRGFVASSYNQHDQFSTAIVTGAGLETEALILRLPPNAVLSGHVTDETGEPVRSAQIMVYRENRFSGVSRVTRYRAASTDDLGRYEITQLEEGIYFVSAKCTPWYAMHPPSVTEDSTETWQVDRSLDVAYPITYYGDATEPEEAAAIPVRGGDRLEADIHLSPVPAIRLTFRLPENPSHGMAYPSFQRPEFDGTEQVDIGGMQSVSPGMYEITGIPPGRYLVRIPDGEGQLRAPSEVQLSSSQALDGMQGAPTSSVKIKVEMAGTDSLPRGLQLGLRNPKARVVAHEVDEKGDVAFEDLVPGRYDVVAGSLTEVYSVTRITTEAGITPGRTLTVAGGANLSVSVNLASGTSTVEGIAKRNGKGVGGAMVVLVPKDEEANRDRFRRDQTDLDGTFTLPNVVPGSYTVIAIEDGWELDWAKPAVLAGYLKRGQQLQIKDHAASTVHIPAPVDVQDK